MQKLWTTLLISIVLCFIPPFVYAANATTASSALAASISSQQDLDAQSLQLIALGNQLANPKLDEETLITLQDSVENLMASVQEIQQKAQKDVNQQNALLTALGPITAAGAAPEDPATAAKRQQLTATLAAYNEEINQANAIISHAHSLFKTITQRRLQNKAKNLMQRSYPLYHSRIWQTGLDNSDDVAGQAWRNMVIMIKSSAQALENSTIGLYVSLTVAIATVLGSVLGWTIYRRYGRRFVTATPTLFRKIMTAAANTLAKGIIPTATFLFIVYELNVLHVFNALQKETLTNIIITLGGIRIARVLIQNILAPSMPNWRLLNVQDESARLLARQLLLFTILASFNWFISTIDERLPLTVLLPCEFILRVSACMTGLIMLRKHYWQSTKTEPSAIEGAPSTTRSAQFIFIHYLRIAAIVVFITNPILMLYGYIVLANALFISFLQTVAIVAVVLGLHIVAYQLVGKYVGIGHTNLIDETLNLGDRSKQIVHYWLVVCLDIIFFIGGTVGILLAWGLDKEDLWRFIKPLFLGFSIGHYRFSLSSVLCAVLLFFALITLSKLLQRIFIKHVFPYTNLDSGAQNALRQGISYLGLTIALIVSIGMLGINLTSLALIAGALSVGIGFGLQHVVSNFIAGIILLVERPIKIGDRIIVGTDEGTVRRISVRATEVEAFDGSSVLIPNSQLISERVRNWTFRNPLTRVDVAIGVAYGSDTHLVEQLLLQIAQQHPDIASDPPPRVIFSSFGASSLDFKLLVVVYDVNKRSSVNSELHYSIEKIFREHNIEMPFPQCEVTLKKSL